MSYSITLRSRTDAGITGWYDSSTSWSTDHTRQKLFGDKHEAKLIRNELRSLCPRNAEVVNVEPARVEEKALAISKRSNVFDSNIGTRRIVCDLASDRLRTRNGHQTSRLPSCQPRHCVTRRCRAIRVKPSPTWRMHNPR
jgi:hypothetical protein